MRPSEGALAQLARASRWQCEGHRFDSDMLHENKCTVFGGQVIGVNRKLITDYLIRIGEFGFHGQLLHPIALNKFPERFFVGLADWQQRPLYLHVILMDYLDGLQRYNE